VTDVTDYTFATAVVERSRSVPVVVDLWADWCGPCKTLGPILARVVEETAGGVELATVDIEANPQIKEAFRVQSIPAVYAFVDGKIVSQFTGALPEAQLRTFVQNLLGTVVDTASVVAAGDEESLREALAVDLSKVEIAVALGELLVTTNRAAEAVELLTPHEHQLAAKTVLARARLSLAGIRLDGDLDETLARLLEQALLDEAVRTQFLQILDALGPLDPRYVSFRRQLANRLY
jgi:putative thioredoxin